MLPTICWLCHVPAALTSGLCKTCFADLPRLPPVPLKPIAAQEKGSKVRLWLAALSYRDCVVRWIKLFKFSKHSTLSRDMAPLMAAHAIRLYQAQGVYMPDALVPVPLSYTRWFSRGFNQAELLAIELSDILGIPVIHPAERSRSTRTSYGLTARDRVENIAQAFSCVRPEQLLPYKRIAIIDDVITTGTTARELAGVLYNGRQITDVWALGFTPAPH